MRSRNGRSGGIARVQEPALLIFDGESRQNAGCIGASIDPDPVWPFLDLLRDGVAVNHDEAMRCSRFGSLATCV